MPRARIAPTKKLATCTEAELFDEPVNSPDSATSSAEQGPGATPGAGGPEAAETKHTSGETKASIKTDGNPPKTESSSGMGISGGQMFMMFLTLIGIVLVAQGLRKKNSKNIPSEFAELDAIRRDLASKYPIEPSKPKAATGPAIQASSELQALADRLAAQLDARAARIEALLQQADVRMAELRQLAAQSADAPVARIGGGVQVEGTRSPLRLETQVDPMQRRVYDLADAGMSPVEIARAVQQPTGHVELILNLRATARSAIN